MIISDIEKYKNKIIDIVIIILAVVIAGNIYKNYIVSMKTLNSQKQEEIEKSEIAANIVKLQKEFDTYKAFINNKDISLAINNINNIAKAIGVKIISIKPEQVKTEGQYEIYPFQLAISAQRYEDVGNFISSLESVPEMFIVESIDFKPQKEEIEIEEGKKKKIFNILNVNLKISTSLLKQ